MEDLLQILKYIVDNDLEAHIDPKNGPEVLGRTQQKAYVPVQIIVQAEKYDAKTDDIVLACERIQAHCVGFIEEVEDLQIRGQNQIYTAVVLYVQIK